MMIVPRDCLPEDEPLRRSFLRKIFPHHETSSSLRENGWEISFRWPETADGYVDPRIMEGVRWWSPALTVAEVPLAYRQESGWQLSLNDSWTLYSWSRWLAARQSAGRNVEQVVVLHIDEHDDMMTPHIWVGNDGWEDAFTSKPFDLYNPESVRDSLVSGAVGIESFIVPLAYWIPEVHIRHLRATADPSLHVRRLMLRRMLLEDTVLGKSRPALRPVGEDVENKHQSELVSYTSTKYLDEWLRDLPPFPILLHFDLDFCNNRYNANSDWQVNSWGHDPEIAQVLASIDAVFDALSTHKLISRIVDVTAALSPGFFPAEFWPAAVERLQLHLSKWNLQSSHV